LPGVLDRVLAGTGWDEGALTVFGDGGVELEGFTKAGVKKKARWRWSEASAPELEGQKLGEEATTTAQALAFAAGIQAAEPGAIKPGRFVRTAYALSHGPDGKAKGELRTF
jgi:hypothetical protein